MDTKRNIPNILEPNNEYTYQEAFSIFDVLGKEACAKENRAIEKNNKKKQRRVDQKNSKIEEEEQRLNAKSKRFRWSKIIIFSIVLAFITILISTNGDLFFPSLIVFFFILTFIIKSKKNYLSLKYFEETPLNNYTYYPSGTIQCSSCGTKTKIDTKNKNSSCPNCHSEIFVISKMETNVIVKTIAQKK